MGIPGGDYLANGSQLKISVTVARSLTETTLPKIQSPTNRSEIFLELESSIGRSMHAMKSTNEIPSPTLGSSRLRIGDSMTPPLGDIGLEVCLLIDLIDSIEKFVCKSILIR